MVDQVLQGAGVLLVQLAEARFDVLTQPVQVVDLIAQMTPKALATRLRAW